MVNKATRENSLKGILLSLLVIPVGIALWVLIWNFGFISAIVSFIVAFGAVWLYKLGSGGAMPTTRDTWILLGVILVAVFLSFLGGMVSDAWQVYAEGDAAASFFSADFADFVMSNLVRGELWSEYMTDLLLSLVFATLGAGVLVRELFAGSSEDTKPQAS